MEKYRGVINAIIGVIFAILVFLAVFYFINYNLQKTKNLRLEEKLKTAMVDKSTMADELELGEEEKQALRDQIASERKKLSASLNSRDNLAANAGNLNKLIRMSDNQIRQLAQEKNFLQSNAIELTAKLQETLARNRALQKKLGIMKTEISALKQKLQQKKALISEKTIEADIAGAEVESLQSDLAALEEKAGQERADFLREKAQLGEELKQKETLISEKTIEADMAGAEAESLQSDLAALEEKAEQDQAGFKENKLQLARKLEQNKISLKTMFDKLAERKNDIALLVGDNARSRTLLKEKAAQLAEIEAGVEQLSDAVADLSPRLITKINFATGEWRLNASQKAVLDEALKKMRGYGPDFIGLVKGNSDPQSFPDNSDHKNLKLSTLRALSVESYLLRKPEGIPPVAIMGLGKIFAPTEPANNQAERTAAVFIIKKNPPDLDGLLTGLRNCFKEAN